MDNGSNVRRVAGTAFAGLVLVGSAFGAAACSDEDGDGNTVDEEVDEIEDDVRDGVDEIEDQVDEGTEEDGESDNG